MESFHESDVHGKYEKCIGTDLFMNVITIMVPREPNLRLETI